MARYRSESQGMRATLALALVLTLAPWSRGGAGTPRPTTGTITDKTFVVWVYPANLSQRGGSALTLIDEGEHFDAVVLGERAQARWMAGSDFFRRTQRDQSAYPAETADAKTRVQIAVAYKGKQIAICRNGKPYASYAIAQPQPFGRDASVLIGLRYVGHMGEIGFFAGAIEEARIYDAALDAGTIAALEPNKPSDPRPIGQWTFEDGTAADSMGTFPAGQLCGGARIADGRLHLNGSDAYMISENVSPHGQRMFYKARSKQTGNMWDTWLFFHNATYHLYYLAKRGRQWNNISMATSPDGVHWAERGRILAKAKGVTWMGTGSTWKSPNFARDGKFHMNFSEWRGPRQTIFFAESNDLLHWTRLGNELEFKQDERWYKRNGRWDCIWTIPRPGGGLYGYWTATPKPETGGRFGFGQTLDGVRWEALEPPKTPGVGGGEVGAIEQIGGRYYMMFGTGGLMVTLVADRPQGPFRPARKNLRLLSGHTYFSRFFPTPDGLLANHHAIARNRQVYFGTLKRAVLDKEGTLRLAWWPGNEKLKTEPVQVTLPAGKEGRAPAVTMLANAFDIGRGIIVEGTLRLPSSKKVQPRGLYIECGEARGVGILVGAGGACELGPIAADGTAFKPDKRVDRQMPFGKPARFRLLLKHSLLEFYLDDVLIECYSLPAAATGRLGLIQGRTKDTIADLRAWR